MATSLLASPRRVFFSSGACEGLKYLALSSMVADHINKAVFNGAVAWLVPAGRLAFPVFACVVAYNLARPHADIRKALLRLLLVAAIATPFHPVVADGAWLPLNVLMTFAVATAVVGCLREKQYSSALVIFVIASFFVDYQWSGVALVVFAWRYAVQPSRGAAAGVLASLVGISLLVGNGWSFAALPVLWVAQYYTPRIPRLRWLFWAFYPMHLALLWSLAR